MRQLRRNPIDLAVVRVELLELDALRLVNVDEVENSDEFFLSERTVQTLHDLLELDDRQLTVPISVIGVICCI